MGQVVFLLQTWYVFYMNAHYFRREEAAAFTVPGGTTGVIYPSHPHGEHTIAHVSMKGAYPDSGYSINDRCTETLFMLSGSFAVRVDEKVYHLEKGDELIILPGSKYRIEGEGEALDLITPSWDKAQNKLVADETFTIATKN